MTKYAYKFHIIYKQMLNKSGVDGFGIISVKTEWSAESLFVSMATHDPKEWGCANKNMDISAAIHLKILNLVPNYFLVI